MHGLEAIVVEDRPGLHPVCLLNEGPVLDDVALSENVVGLGKDGLAGRQVEVEVAVLLKRTWHDPVRVGCWPAQDTIVNSSKCVRNFLSHACHDALIFIQLLRTTSASQAPVLDMCATQLLIATDHELVEDLGPLGVRQHWRRRQGWR